MKKIEFFRKINSGYKEETNLNIITHPLKKLVYFTVFILCLSGCSDNNEIEPVLGTFTIEAGDHDRYDIPIRYVCKSGDLFVDSVGNILSGDHHLMLYEEGVKRSKIYAQWEPEALFSWEKHQGQGALIWILNGKTVKGSKRVFNLVLKKGSPPAGLFTIEDLENRKLLISKGIRPVLQYNYDIIHEVEGQTNPFDKSSYIHPVWTPEGEIITGDFSPEHIWQRGIFLAWQKVKFGDIATNFWELGNATGRTLKDNKDPFTLNGKVFTELVIYNKGTVEGKTHFKELCVVRLYNRLKQDNWMFDITFRQWPVDPENPDTLPSTLKVMDLEKVYYGGMSFRGVSPGWLHYDFIAKNKEQLSKFKPDTKWLDPADSLKILTSDGYGRKNGNGTPARWIDYTGPLGKGWGGLVMFDNPYNQRYPTPLRIHPDMPYFCFAFAKDTAYSITSETPLELTYRVVVHNGSPDKELNEHIAMDFENPPHIEWKMAK